MLRTFFAVTTLSLVLVTSASAAEKWGDVSGKVLWKGDVPAKELQHKASASVKDAEVCAEFDVYKDDLVVNPDNKGIANCFVYLRKKPKKINPALKDFEPQIVFDQKNCIFKPHALLVRAGQTVEVLNSDPVSHNTHTYPIRNRGENLTIPGNTAKGSGTPFKMKSRESTPIQVKCDFHAWMTAYWLIVDHPYAAVTDENGEFKIEGLPAGSHTLTVWHERAGYLNRKLKVKVKAGEETVIKAMEYKIEAK